MYATWSPIKLTRPCQQNNGDSILVGKKLVHDCIFLIYSVRIAAR